MIIPTIGELKYRYFNSPFFRHLIKVLYASDDVLIIVI